MFFNTLSWIIKNRKNKDKSIICDGSYMTVTPWIVWLAKYFKIKIVAIIADIYDYMSDRVTKVGKTTLIKKISSKFGSYCFNNYNGYILLTEAMNEIVNDKKVPYVIMEGLVDKNNYKHNEKNKKYSKFVIMYAGVLVEKYGVKALVDSISKLKEKNVELILYGTGELVEYIEGLGKKDNRIKYKGILNNEDIIKEEEKATLLVNPRFTNNEYTKYSFPSKNMEYMVSGTPVLTTRLPGMPKEYEQYVYLIENETEEGITKIIEEIIKIDKKTLDKKGKESKEFVIQNKNNVVQANRLLEFIKKM